ncbi:MAG: hypothetical protein IK122_01685 [Alphaproteobacteria bacterium]|nr:hypothetical protein [Alphaproteobacteria bacterium]MBR5903993.1 hypothetical protein [Alphaproteobacteria bacterium]
MFIIFNKEYRKFESIMSELISKMKKSAKIDKKYEGNAEVYKLDTVDIVCGIGVRSLIVRDKTGAEIIALDCHYSGYKELQRAKSVLFGNFLEKVRNIYHKRIEKADKLKKATEAAKIKEETEQRIDTARAHKEKLLNDALAKLRGL